MNSAEPLGTLEVALRHAARLLERDPSAAAEQAEEILKVHPDQPNALALSGLALGRLGKGDDAIAALRRAVHFKPQLHEAWRALGDHYSALEMREAADESYAQSVRYSTRDPRLMSAALALVENRIPDAEGELREFLKRHPTDVAAIRMLAEVAARLGRYGDAEKLPQLRDSAASAGQARTRTGRSGAIARRRRTQSRLSQSPGGHPGAPGRIRRVHRRIPGGACRVSEAAEGVDEHGPCAQDGRAQPGEH